MVYPGDSKVKLAMHLKRNIGGIFGNNPRSLAPPKRVIGFVKSIAQCEAPNVRCVSPKGYAKYRRGIHIIDNPSIRS